MADYKTYLAANILTEDKVVTYRLLSRALKIHVNSAKEMLYEFHRLQNGKKPGSIHATYLLSGTKPKPKEESVPASEVVAKDGEDDFMQSSPFVGSPLPQVDEGTGESGVMSITLAREEDLDNAKSQYDHITSIHIYSLGPSPMKDLQTLSDINREVHELSKHEDPLTSLSQYGTITNPQVRRRTGRRPPPAAAPPSLPAKSQTAPKPKVETKDPPKTTSKPETKSSQSSTARDFFGSKGKEKSKDKEAATTKTSTSVPSSKESTPAPPAAAPATLKRDSSAIFKSFAKAKPKLKREDTDTSVATSAAAEDSPMNDIHFDDDDDEEEEDVPTISAKKDGEEMESRNMRKQREAALKAMMEDDDDDDEIVEPDHAPEPETEPQAKKSTSKTKAKPASKAKAKSKAAVKKDDSGDVEMKDGGDDVENDEDGDAVEVAGETKEEVQPSQPGRRRGRRRVMKKKQIKDDEGYLVTHEEAVWESFSEEEPTVPAPSKPKLSSGSSGLGAGGKAKKGAAGGGGKAQGNIMAFFGKK